MSALSRELVDKPVPSCIVLYIIAFVGKITYEADRDGWLVWVEDVGRNGLNGLCSFDMGHDGEKLRLR